MIAYVFPGQGAQFAGMGRDLYEQSALARELFREADEVLGFRISEIMFSGSDDDLLRTSITQPAIFIHSVVSYLVAREGGAPAPDMVAGHSLGEYSALVAAGVLSFADALRLVSRRAEAMQYACDLRPSSMAAVTRLPDETVEAVCADIEGVVPANYNCPGQLVISGTVEAVQTACQRLKEAGARRAIVLPVNGAFHSPLMQPAADKLAEAIMQMSFSEARCPVYQNADAEPHTAPEEIRSLLLQQLTSPVRWTASVRRMLSDGATDFREFGPGEVLTGLIRNIRS